MASLQIYRAQLAAVGRGGVLDMAAQPAGARLTWRRYTVSLTAPTPTRRCGCATVTTPARCSTSSPRLASFACMPATRTCASTSPGQAGGRSRHGHVQRRGPHCQRPHPGGTGGAVRSTTPAPRPAATASPSVSGTIQTRKNNASIGGGKPAELDRATHRAGRGIAVCEAGSGRK